MNTSTTQAQQFAAAFAANMAKQMLRTIRWVRWAATGIMLAAMVTSYSHQAEFLAHIGTPAQGAWVLPGIFDALTFVCVKVLGTPGMATAGKRVALRMLTFPVLVSGAINFAAPGQIITKLGFVAAVLAIPAAEIVAAHIKPDFSAMDAMERSVVAESAPVAEVDDAQSAVRRAAAVKAAATRAANKAEADAKAEARRAARKAAAEERRALQATWDLPAAPVSPAPATWDQVARMIDQAQDA